MGDVSTHQENYGRIFPPVDTTTDRAAANMAGVRELVIPPTGSDDFRVGLGGCGDIR